MLMQMDKRTKKNLLLFFRRFRSSYREIAKSYNGTNAHFYLENFIQDNLKVAHQLFGQEGEKMMKDFVKKVAT